MALTDILINGLKPIAITRGLEWTTILRLHRVNGICIACAANTSRMP